MSHGQVARTANGWRTRCSSTSTPMRTEHRWPMFSTRTRNTEQGAARMNQIVEKPKKYSLVERAPAASFEEERLHRKQRLAATFRLFSRYGFDQGLAGHVTVRDPEFPDRFWINPLSKFFGQIKGLLTVGPTIDATAWWYIAMDNAARTQLLAEAAGTPKPIPHEVAKLTASQVGTHKGGYFSFQPLWDWITEAEPDLFN